MLFSVKRLIVIRPSLMLTAKMSSSAEAGSDLTSQVRSVVPALTATMRKGACGRVAVIGGSALFAGAPYYAAIAAMKVGADMVHVYCERDAAQAIKSYSPELIVHAVLDEKEEATKDFESWIATFGAVVVGPGLGRSEKTISIVAEIMQKVRARDIPMCVDADGLWIVNQRPELVQSYSKAVLTPNAMEFSRLVKVVLKRPDPKPMAQPDPQEVNELARAMGGVTIVHKGAVDVIADGNVVHTCDTDGSPRRCGGQGDVISGACCLFLFWAHSAGASCPAPGPSVLAAWAATRLVRACAAVAFAQHGRSTTTVEIIKHIGPQFDRLFETTTNK